ncbi:hypothetical protein TGAM01_v205247 [Trichoderma gamsii]|uniref:Uncharacterized protein n=1 Tax=Trichoderma gamsii TaxID=398673 RepID=A0A2P4ZNE4_9HYPO|nr:hypothetical protein TGAM01_v205247 [Trichoderma gamsii]PON25810.1 hypothetical protein TGAM01_v205247 [Trichoderma gamsii]
MGGLAFTSGKGALCTPRMPKQVYETTKARCQEILRRLYHLVESPLDGPGKADFGDIDMFLASPTPEASTGLYAVNIISKALGAERTLVEGGRESINIAASFAIPWPSDEPSNAQDADKKHIQVDVRVCESEDKLRWMLFKHGHGDLWQIVGSQIRPYGLTVDDTAMSLRIPKIEESNKKLARVFLTSDPSKVLDFLGLPKEEYWDHPFPSAEDMFDYIGSSRLIYVAPTASEPDAKSLKSDDRRRMKQRPIFKKWMDEFVPECRQSGRFSERRLTREAITEEAFAVFGVETEYKARRKAFLIKRQKDYIWNTLIKDSFPTPNPSDSRAILHKSCSVKALKEIILGSGENYSFPLDQKSLKNSDGFYDMKYIEEFIETHKDEVGKAALVRHNEKYAEHLYSKGTKATMQPS